LIARQRSVLNRTFIHEHDSPVSPELTRRLEKSQEEIAAATEQLSQGLTQRGQPVAVLEEALALMNQARTALADSKLGGARGHEEEALADLISARQNLRKMLSQSNSQQASACRSFDRQQQQALRKPPEDKKTKQLANLEKDLRALAQAERTFSEELESPKSSTPPAEESRPEQRLAETDQPRPSSPAASGASSGSKTQGGSASGSPARSDPVARQEQALKEAERLRDLAQQDQSLTERARRRLGDATETVRKSAAEIKEGREAEAATDARTASVQLERLARQVGALKAKELADQMARTRDLARGMASDQRSLEQALRSGASEPGNKSTQPWATQQRWLSEDASDLGVLLDRIREEAADESPSLAQTITQLARENRLRDIENAMRQSAAALESGRRSEAERAVEPAARGLDALASALDSARRGLVQPLLDRFLAAEKQAAGVREQLGKVRTSDQQAQAERALSDLAGSLESLSSSESTLGQAAEALRQAVRPGASHAWRREEPQAARASGFFIPPIEYDESLRGALAALQSRIQQLVLDRVQMQRDGPVPLRYKTLVEDYYRVLSQDLR
jgi:hypothetical protein